MVTMKLAAIDFSEDLNVSMAMDRYVDVDGIPYKLERLRCAFVPGDIEKVKLYLGVSTGPEIDYLNAIWTEEVIAEYQSRLVNE